MEKMYKKIALFIICFFACTSIQSEIDERTIERVACIVIGALAGSVGTGIYLSQKYARQIDALDAQNAAKDKVIEAHHSEIQNLRNAYDQALAPQMVIKRLSRLLKDEHERDAKLYCAFLDRFQEFLLASCPG